MNSSPPRDTLFPHAGPFRSLVAGGGGTTAPYSFRLLNVAGATSLTIGTAVSGTLDPANETDLYQFEATGGNRVYFDAQAQSGAPNARWPLGDPFDNVGFERDFNNPGPA